jgi:predicted acylesterase/phospholipase RssA
MTDPRSGRRFELVLGGCGALGAFQAGVYEALEEAGREPICWSARRSAR